MFASKVSRVNSPVICAIDISVELSTGLGVIAKAGSTP